MPRRTEFVNLFVRGLSMYGAADVTLLPMEELPRKSSLGV